MYKYLFLNFFFGLVTLLVVVAVKPKLPRKRLLIVMGSMLLLTAVFDSLIIGLDMVRYNTEFISGLLVIKAPIEDFFYTVVATMLTITLWERGKNEPPR